jgi:FKBP-type peptidyl-prolyl cis-trans isomerase SlyD
MMSPEKPQVVADDVVVTMEYTVKVDGEVVDSSDDHEPIEFLQGHSQVISGLEKQLYGMAVGDSKSFAVAPGEGYGERDADAIADIPRGEFPDEIPLEPGVELQMEDEDGDVMNAVIVSAGEKTIRLDFNHPLAGKELHFSVQVIGLRQATAEELEHGHAHSEGHHH